MLMFAYPVTSRHEDPVGSRNIFSSMDGGELQDDAAQVPRKYIGAILGVLACCVRWGWWAPSWRSK